MKIKFVFALATIVYILAACNSTDFQKTKAGAPYKIISDGKGQKIDSGNIAKYQLTEKIKDSVLYTTYGQAPMYNMIAPAPLSYDPRSIVGDLLMQARKGDSIYFVMAMDSFIKQDPTIVKKTPFKKGDQLIFTIRVLDVFKTPQEANADMEKENLASYDKMEKEGLEAFNKDAKAQEQKKKDEKEIENYLTANHIQTQRTPWGDYIQILSPGDGTKPKPGQFVMVRYTGSDLAGKVFDSNTAPGRALLPAQIGGGGSIRGFEDALKQLSKGAKVKIFIPSVIGYGSTGNPPAGIQPNENLVFEIEVVDITDTPPQQQMPQQMPDTTKHK